MRWNGITSYADESAQNAINEIRRIHFAFVFEHRVAQRVHSTAK